MAGAAQHTGAQAQLGSLYLKGVGVNRDIRKAQHWFALAAEQGHSGAQFQLGVLYAGGTGVGYSYEKSGHWLRAAVQQWWGD